MFYFDDEVEETSYEIFFMNNHNEESKSFNNFEEADKAARPFSYLHGLALLTFGGRFYWYENGELTVQYPE